MLRNGLFPRYSLDEGMSHKKSMNSTATNIHMRCVLQEVALCRGMPAMTV